MYESKEKSKEEPASGKAALGDSKEDTQKASEGTAELLRALLKKVCDGENMGLNADQPDILYKALGKTTSFSGLWFGVSEKVLCDSEKNWASSQLLGCLKFDQSKSATTRRVE